MTGRSPCGCLAGIWVLVMGASCAHGDNPPPRSRLALLPGATLGVSELEGHVLEDALRSELQNVEEIELVATPPEISASECQESNSCVATVGRELASDLVLSLTLAGLGDVRLVRARLVDVDEAVAVQDLQETVDAGDESLRAYALDLRQRLFPRPPSEAWYEKWWIWTAAAAVVGVSVGVTWWALRQPADDNAVHLGDL